MSVVCTRSVSSRAAQTARDLSSALTLPRRDNVFVGQRVIAVWVTPRTTARSLGALCQPRDDSALFDFEPEILCYVIHDVRQAFEIEDR